MIWVTNWIIHIYIYIYMQNIVSLFNLLIITQTWAGIAGDRHKRQETYLSASWLFMPRRRALTWSSMNTPVSTLEELTRISYVFLFWYRLQQLYIVHSIKSRVLNSAWIMNGRNFISSKFSVPRFFSVFLSGEWPTVQQSVRYLYTSSQGWHTYRCLEQTSKPRFFVLYHDTIKVSKVYL